MADYKESYVEFEGLKQHVDELLHRARFNAHGNRMYALEIALHLLDHASQHEDYLLREKCRELMSLIQSPSPYYISSNAQGAADENNRPSEMSPKEMLECLKKNNEKILNAFLKKNFGINELGYLEEEQIAAAINETDKSMKGHSNWCGIYIILVSECGWPDDFKGFEKRVKRLEAFGLHLSEDNSFDYQGLQKGWDENWPKDFKEWLTYQDGTSAFKKHRTLASIFLKNLKEQMPEKQS